MKYLIAVALGMAIVMAILSAESSPGAAQLAAERTAQIQAQEAARVAQIQAQEAERTTRTAITEAARTERAAERESTFRLALLLLVVIVAAGVILAIAALWLRRPVQQHQAAHVRMFAPPADVVRMAAALNAALEYDDTDGWILVERDGRYITVSDAARLLTMR